MSCCSAARSESPSSAVLALPQADSRAMASGQPEINLVKVLVSMEPPLERRRSPIIVVHRYGMDLCLAALCAPSACGVFLPWPGLLCGAPSLNVLEDPWR